jgi:hypothetical protein
MSIWDRIRREKQEADEYKQMSEDIRTPISQESEYVVPKTEQYWRKGEAAVERAVEPIVDEAKEDVGRVAKKQNLAAALKAGAKGALKVVGYAGRSFAEGLAYDPNKDEQTEVKFHPENLVEGEPEFDFSAPGDEEEKGSTAASKRIHKEADLIEAKRRKFNEEGRYHELEDATSTHLEGALDFDDITGTEETAAKIDEEEQEIWDSIQKETEAKMAGAGSGEDTQSYDEGPLGEEERRGAEMLASAEKEAESAMSGGFTSDEEARKVLESFERSGFEAMKPSLDLTRPVKVTNYRRRNAMGPAVPVRKHSRTKPSIKEASIRGKFSSLKVK